MVFAVLFPGQGSQFVGMGAGLFERHPDLLGTRTDEILGFSLQSLCAQGPEDELTRTEHAQPALFALAFALWTELEPQLPGPPAAAAGHSLGEYTALTASGALDFVTALRIVAERGRAMAAAADAEESAMAALIGADEILAEALATGRRDTGGRLYVANINAPGQVVMAGGVADIDWLEANARGLGVRRVVRLKVAGAFHSPFMAPASDRVGVAVAALVPSEPSFPVYANVTGAPGGRSEIASLLTRQVVSPVRFSESLTAMAAAGVDTFVHVGPGDVTAGMARRTVPDAATIVVSDPEDISAAVAALERSEK